MFKEIKNKICVKVINYTEYFLEGIQNSRLIFKQCTEREREKNRKGTSCFLYHGFISLSIKRFRTANGFPRKSAFGTFQKDLIIK